MERKVLIKSLVIKSAVNIESTTPRARVTAKPFTVPVPIIPRTAAAISVVTFPSMMAESALWKPLPTECQIFFPSLISSRIRAKTMTFASTAIPIERMIPAIPGRVSVILKR